MRETSKVSERNIAVPKSVEELRTLLEQYGVDLGKWDAFSVELDKNLYNMLVSKEAGLIDLGGKLFLTMRVACVNVWYESEGSKFVLYEEKIVMQGEGGGKRVLDRKKGWGITEKVKFGEDPVEAAVRGVGEEIGVKVLPKQLTNYRCEEKELETRAFPTLYASYKFHIYDLVLSGKEVHPNGYIEVDGNKTSYFKWRKE